MAESLSSSRFRIRLADGDELLISSVEALARRVARGDVEPHTELFDASTDAWQGASEASVVQFILDEMRREGVELPHGWASEPPVEPKEESPIESSDEEENGPSEEADHEEPPALDPLSLGLTLAPPEEPSLPEVVSEAASAAHRDPIPGPPPKEKWVTDRSSGGLLVPPRNEKTGPPTRPAPPGERARPPRGARGLPSAGGRWMWFAGGAVVAVAFLISSFSDGPGGGGPGGQGQQSQESSAEPALLVVPDGLGAEVQRSADLATESAREAMDSLQLQRGLPNAPPADWLSGYYLANATEFPELRQFWVGHGRLLQDVRAADESVFLNALSEGMGLLEASPADIARIEVHLRARYDAAASPRLERYEQLTSVAATALELHTFLSDRTGSLEYTPALGTGTPARDPVLEVATEDPAVRRELNLRLDALVEALDRSTGRDEAFSAGVWEELVSGLIPF